MYILFLIVKEEMTNTDRESKIQITSANLKPNNNPSIKL